MANFGPSSPNPEHRGGGQVVEEGQQNNGRQEQQQDQRAEGKEPDKKESRQKNKKKKQISELLDTDPQVTRELYEMLHSTTHGTAEQIGKAIEEKSFHQIVKTKNKQQTVDVIRKAEFLGICQGLSESTISAIEPLVYLNPKYGELYQVKNIGFLFNEVAAKADLLENAKVTQGQDGAQVVSFKQLESDEER